MILPIGKNKSAFTLIEMLLVLLLVGVVLGMTVAAIPRGSKVVLKKFSEQMIVDFKYAQAMAISSGDNIEVVLNVPNQYRINQLSNPIKPLKVRDYPPALKVDSSLQHIYFYPDGSSSQVEIKINVDRDELLLSNGLHRFRWVIEYATTQETI